MTEKGCLIRLVNILKADGVLTEENQTVLMNQLEHVPAEPPQEPSALDLYPTTHGTKSVEITLEDKHCCIDKVVLTPLQWQAVVMAVNNAFGDCERKYKSFWENLLCTLDL